jgi:hypothetical protein
MMNLKKTNIIICITLCYASTVFAGVYKWVDKDNQVHYSNRPESNATRLNNIKSSTNSKTQQQDELDAMKAKLKQYEDDKAKAATEAENQKNLDTLYNYNCNAANKKLTSLQPARVREVSASGEVRYLSENERQAEIAKAKLEVNQFCNEK